MENSPEQCVPVVKAFLLHFDVLHTLGKNYLIGDIEEYLKPRGEKIAEGL